MEKQVYSKNLIKAASQGLANFLEYRSFQDFLQDTTYCIINLKRGNIIDFRSDKLGELQSNDQQYDKLKDYLIKSYVSIEDTRHIQIFTSRQFYVKAYKEQKFSGALQFSCIIDDEIHYKQINYQIFEENSDIFVIIMIIDTDGFMQKNKFVHSATYDPLTDLRNRATMDELAKSFIEWNRSSAATYITMDIDDFKKYNDTYGHETGDEVLIKTAKYLKDHFGKYGVVCRMGGDEFAIFLRNISSTEADQLIKEFYNKEHYITYNDERVEFTYSMGYVSYPERAISYKEMIHEADMALYNVKLTGKNSFTAYIPEHEDVFNEHKHFGLTDILEGVPGGLIIFNYDDGNKKIYFCNEETYKMFDCKTKKDFYNLCNNNFFPLIHSEDALKVIRDMNSQFLNGDTYGSAHISFRIKTYTGQYPKVYALARLKEHERYGKLVYIILLRDKHNSFYSLDDF